MNDELFGVFGDESQFVQYRSPTAFDRILEGPSLTVGVRADGLEVSGWTHAASNEDGICVVWGEAYLPGKPCQPAEWLLNEYPQRGIEVVEALNGSFIVVIDDGDNPVIVGDQLRTRECFYTDTFPPRVFSTDPTALTKLLAAPSIDEEAVQEFVHMGVVLGDRTFFDELHRLPFDGYLTPNQAGELTRFVYNPTEFDYVDSLAHRLRHAIERRADQPGDSGVLLSAGFDSRVFLSEGPAIDHCYTVGRPDSDEVDVSVELANQYDVPHTILDPADGYLNTDPATIQYGQSVKESLQIHHAIDDASIEVDSIYHGLLFDTLLSGHFRPSDDIDVLGYSIPVSGIESEPDIAESLLWDNFGFWALDEYSEAFTGAAPGQGSLSFCRDAIQRQRERLAPRFDRAANGIAAVGIQNQPTLPFHTHLADQFFTPFLAADGALIDWHLRTPPEKRTEATYRKALKRVNSDLLSPRPPDRPHRSRRLNQIESVLRQRIGVLESFDSAWPDRNELYNRHGFDERWFGDAPAVQSLPPRVKLRVHDVQCWIESIAGSGTISPEQVLTPHRV